MGFREQTREELIHKPEEKPPLTSIDAITQACEGLSISPMQLYQELDEGGDLPDLAAGNLPPPVLREVARALAD